MSDDLSMGFDIPAQMAGLKPVDESLHEPPKGLNFDLTETSYYGFSIGERALNAEIYLWFHPNLNVMSAGVYIWQGLKTYSLEAEYVNHIHFLPVIDDILDYELAMGLKVKVIDPFREIHITYKDEHANTSFDVTFTAFGPPVSRPGGAHMIQPMKTKGALTLRGEEMPIDGTFIRDRSWGQGRSEDRRLMPPMTWMGGCFDDGRVFHALAFDDPRCEPDWKADYPFPPPGMNLMWGYVQIGQKITPLAKATKLTRRGDDGLRPESFTLSLEDAEGGTYEIEGEVRAVLPWQTWQNMLTWFCQTHWRWDGVSGIGDAQDIQFNDYIVRTRARKDAA